MTVAHRVLVLFAHPVIERSRVNRCLLDHITGLEGVTVRDLYEHYPTFAIDVAAEQELLLEHDVIVFQHPLFWYSTPAILKEWQDLVLEHGWAYGDEGRALEGKLFLVSTTTGGSEFAYRTDGQNRFTMREFLVPLEQTAALCRMRYIAPYVVHGSLLIAGLQDAKPHALGYRAFIEALRDGRLDLEAASRADSIRHDNLASFIQLRDVKRSAEQ